MIGNTTTNLEENEGMFMLDILSLFSTFDDAHEYQKGKHSVET
jgi:hypothetical protein